MLNEQATQVAAKMLAAMANHKRLEILGHLLNHELSVTEIAQRVSLSQSALSQHLSKLRNANLVATRRDKQMILYSSQSEAVSLMYKLFEKIFS